MALIELTTTKENLGIKSIDNTFNILINKNSLLPLDEKFSVLTNKNEIEFYQGNDLLAEKNIFLKKYKVSQENKIKINIDINFKVSIKIYNNKELIIDEWLNFKKETNQNSTDYDTFRKIQLKFIIKTNINKIIENFNSSNLIMNEEEKQNNISNFKNLLNSLEEKSIQHLVELDSKLIKSFYFL